MTQGRNLPPREGKAPEPVAKAGAGAAGATALTAALLAILDQLGALNLDGEAQAAIITFVGIVAPIVASLVARAKVYALRP